MLTEHESQTRPDNIVFGALPSPIDVRTYKAVCAAGASPDQESFPDEFQLWKPSTKNQGGISSCVAHAISSVVEYFNYIQEHNNTVFSTAYIYGNRSNYSGKGMYTSQAVHNLLKYGDCPETRFKGNYEVPEAIDKFKDQLVGVFADAWPHRISAYFSVVGETNMKATLMEYGPIVIAVTWRSGTKLVTEDGVKYVLRLHKETASEGGHCMYIYGWNKKGWLVGNSWGTGWGDNGSCILPYDEPINERWGIQDNIISESTKDALIKEYQNRIAELRAANDELEATLQKDRERTLQLSDEVTELSVQLFALQTAHTKTQEELEAVQNKILAVQDELKSRLEEIETLSAELRRTVELVRTKEQEIEECKKTIEGLRNKLLEIEKPYNSKLGDLVAKIINFFLNLFGKKQKE